MPWLARLAWAILAGILAFLAMFVIGILVGLFQSTAGTKIEDFAGIVGVLVGIAWFASNKGNPLA